MSDDVERFPSSGRDPAKSSTLPSTPPVTEGYSNMILANSKDTGLSSSESLWQLYWEYCKSCGIFLSMLSLLLSLSAYALSAWSDWMLSYLADSPTNRSQLHYYYLFLSLSFVVFLNNLFRYLLLALTGNFGSKHLHDELTNSILSAPLQFFDTLPSGRIISRFSSDMDTIDNDIPSSLSSSYDAFLGVLSGLAVVVINSPIFLLLVIPLGYQYRSIQRLYNKASIELKRLDSGSKSPVFSHFNESLSGLEYIRSYQLQTVMIQQHELYLNKSISARYNWDGVNRWLGIRLDLIGALIISGAAYSLLFIDTNSSKGGSAGLMISYALKSTASLSFAVRISTALENMMLSLSRILEFIKIPSELNFIENLPIDPTFSQQQQQQQQQQEDDHPQWNEEERDIESLPLLRRTERSSFHSITLSGCDVSVRYHPSLPLVFSKLNFTLSGGKIVGLCGRTGGGKSTLAKVIARVIANENPPQNIFFNNSSIYSIPLLQYRREYVNLFPQDSYLFSGTVREVVDPHHSFSHEEVLSQLKRFSQIIVFDDDENDSSVATTAVVDTATTAPHKDSSPISHLLNLNYEITANGGNISAGEKQILTLARASLCEARIVILDEITSNMSLRAAEVALKMLRSDLVEKKQSAILLICHRPEDMALCDEVWEISAGSLTVK